MNVQNLIDTLSAMDPDAEVRLAMQPSWPMEYTVDDVVEFTGYAGPTVYLAEGGQVGYLPGDARKELGW